MTQQERMSKAMRDYADALDFVVTPTGEVIYLDAKTRLGIAWHLARAVGADAVIKRRAVTPQPGMIAGAVRWVPLDEPDDDIAPITAHGPVPELRDFDDALPWHVRTDIQGVFK